MNGERRHPLTQGNGPSPSAKKTTNASESVRGERSSAPITVVCSPSIPARAMRASEAPMPPAESTMRARFPVRDTMAALAAVPGGGGGWEETRRVLYGLQKCTIRKIFIPYFPRTCVSPAMLTTPRVTDETMGLLMPHAANMELE